MAKFTLDYPFSNKPAMLLNALEKFDQAFRKRLVRQALELRAQASRARRDALNAFIREGVHLDGFAKQKMHLAPINSLATEVYKLTQVSDDFFQLVLDVWRESHKEAEAVLALFLQDRAVNHGEDANLMLDLAQEFVSQHPDYDLQESVVLIAYLASDLLAKTTSEDEIDESDTARTLPARQEGGLLSSDSEVPHMTIDRFVQWLNELSDLSFSAPEWDEIGLFSEALQALHQLKQRERVAYNRYAELDAALATLRTLPTDAFTYFEFNVTTWTADTCHIDQVPEAVQQVADLQKDITRHYELRYVPTSKRSEEMLRQKTLNELEARIIGTYGQLLNRLQSTSAEYDASISSSNDEPTLDQLPLAADYETPLHSLVESGRPPEDTQTRVLYEEIGLLPLPESVSGSISVEPEMVASTPLGPSEIVEIVEEDALELEPIPAQPSSNASAVPEAQESLELADVSDEASELAISLTPSVTTVSQELSTPKVDQMSPLSGQRSPQAYAEQLQGLQLGLDNPLWAEFLWTLVLADDLSGAMWLARSLQNVPVPDWLLMAMQGARWVTTESDASVATLFEITDQNGFITEPTLAQELLGLATALRPTLVAPFTGLLSWLKVPRDCPGLKDLVEAIRAFASTGLTLHPEDLSGVTGEEERENSIKAAVSAAANWLEHAPTRTTQMSLATKEWRKLVEPNTRTKNSVRDLMLPVIEDRRQELDHVRAMLTNWENRNYVLSRIQLPDLTIVGTPRNQILRYVDEACELGRRWCDLIDYQRKIAHQGKWIYEQVGKLRRDVESALSKTYAALTEMSTHTLSLPYAAGAMCLGRSVAQLQRTLRIPGYSDEQRQFFEVTDWDWLRTNVTDLEVATYRRLLWLPEVDLDDDGHLLPDAFDQLAFALRDAYAESRNIALVAQRWLAKQDYRFMGLLQEVTSDPVSLGGQIQTAVAVSRLRLREEKDSTDFTIDRTLVDGIISEEQANDFRNQAGAIHPDRIQNFYKAFLVLAALQAKLSDVRHARQMELHRKWLEIADKVAESDLFVTERDQIQQFIDAAFQRSDTRVIEESLSQIETALATGRRLKEGWLTTSTERDAFIEFQTAESALEAWLSRSRDLGEVSKEVEDGRSNAGLRFGEVSPALRRDAIEAIRAWRQLKQKPGAAIIEPIRVILHYLGVALDQQNSRQAESVKGQDWVHWKLHVALREFENFPSPQFGSQARGLYNIVCLWDRPSPETIAQRLNELRLKADSVIVFFLGRLTARQRSELLRLRDRRWTLVVLDEILLTFLAQERDNFRLPAFLRCALPFSYANPYTPFQAGDVPPEMFFGRRDLAEELLEPKGPCVVYGGRQLGKSALLRHVQRQFHHPDRQQFAWIENMKLVFDPQGGQDETNVWRVIRKRFQEEGLLLEKTVPAERMSEDERIRRQIINLLRADPSIRVLFMFDESDGFLDAQAEPRAKFRTVLGLRDVMEKTERRFKVIFAGLHNVQRFQGIPDQPLAHFAAVQVGPLEPDAAQKLVRQPLGVLGYRFDDDHTPLRILSYTNYHPGLIQLFCQALIDSLQEGGRSGGPPYLIRSSDVERVYMRHDIGERIKERLDWTLELDPCYQAIAWKMIESQIAIRDSYALPYSVPELLRMAREAWPLGFDDMRLERMNGLLDEMVGLGVLVRRAGEYRLRSPNLVRLMGNENQIRSYLEQLAKREPNKQSDANQHHARLDLEDQVRCSPLTYEQERSLNQAQVAVGLLFASPALGGNLVSKALRRLLPSGGVDGPTGRWAELPEWLSTEDEYVEWFDRFVRQTDSASRLIIYLEPDALQLDAIRHSVQGALKFCERRKVKKQWMRIFYVFSPSATRTWLLLPVEERQALENRTKLQMLRRWNASAIRRRLEDQEMLANDKVVSQLLQATSGWACLIDEAFDRYQAAGKSQANDLSPFVKMVEDDLARADSTLRKDFLDKTGLPQNPEAQAVLRALVQIGERQIPSEYIDLIDLPRAEISSGLDYLRKMDCIEWQADQIVIDSLLFRLMS